MHTIRYFFLFLLIGLFFSVVDSSWWYFSQFDHTSMDNRRVLCEIIPNLNKRQRQICQRHPELVRIIGKGIHKGTSECQFQFRYQRWNCSTFQNDHSLYGKYLIRGGTREMAFIHAMNSASAIYKLAQSCSKGHPKCGCSSELPNGQRTNQTTYTGVFKWEGCENVVQFGTNFVRRFIDAAEMRTSDGKSKFALHNNRVGRIVVRKKMEEVCKCHGVSGSCSMKTCWSTLPSLRIIGDALRDKYDSAVEITFKPSLRIIPNERRHKHPTKYSLIYFERSPDHCRVDKSKGSLGTYNRICKNTIDGEDSCDILCCRRRYDFTKIRFSHNCNCTFTWCCQIHCNVCNETRIEYRCK